MPSRRLHQKSRNGCCLCKKRRVKCDGTLPSCKNCVRYGRACSFLEFQPTSPSKGTSSGTRPITDHLPSMQKSPKNGKPSPLPFNCTDMTAAPAASMHGKLGDVRLEHPECSLVADTLSSQNSSERQSQWMDFLPYAVMNYYYTVRDEELMSNYLELTYRSISNKKSVQDIYRFDIPKEATSHSHLMHAILAVSAAHLMHTRVNERELYEGKAKRHQYLALASAIAELVDINPSNCDALFATAGLIAFLAFALQSPVANISRSTISEVVEFFTLVRGINTVLKSACFNKIVEGKFSALLDYDWHPPIQPLEGDFKTAFDRLNYIKETTVTNREFQETYSTTIQSLQNAFETYSIVARERVLVFSWSVHITDLYLSLVKERDPFSLVILAYYALLLHSIDGVWWSKGRGAWLIEAICEELPSSWDDEIQLPKDVIEGKRTLTISV